MLAVTCRLQAHLVMTHMTGTAMETRATTTTTQQHQARPGHRASRGQMVLWGPPVLLALLPLPVSCVAANHALLAVAS